MSAKLVPWTPRNGRQCLSREGSGNTRQSKRLSEGGGSTRQTQRLRREGDGNTSQRWCLTVAPAFGLPATAFEVPAQPRRGRPNGEAIYKRPKNYLTPIWAVFPIAFVSLHLECASVKLENTTTTTNTTNTNTNKRQRTPEEREAGGGLTELAGRPCGHPPPRTSELALPAHAKHRGAAQRRFGGWFARHPDLQDSTHLCAKYPGVGAHRRSARRCRRPHLLTPEPEAIRRAVKNMD